VNSDTVISQLQKSGYALLQPTEFCDILQLEVRELNALRESWAQLPQDDYLRDGGHYRFRRHSCFLLETAPHKLEFELELVPHRAHWQPTDYNALHGGMERWFAPIEPEVAASDAWRGLISRLGQLFARAGKAKRWYVEAHQFRIDTAAGIGRPTPEGAHRDGVDYVAVILIGRHSVRGGETRVFEAHGTAGVRFTMTQPWTALLLDDATVIHETTPIQPLESGEGVRDTLVLTFRAQGFQAPVQCAS
jgi:hypothetical protein